MPMAKLTWMRVGGPAARVVQPACEQNLVQLMRSLTRDEPVLMVGVGSNLLVRDGGFPGTVVRLAGAFRDVSIDGRDLVAGAGALCSRTAKLAQRAGLSGLEFMIGIPGTVGGSIMMNAGAYGGETADRLTWVDLMDRRGRIERVDAGALQFGYRCSRIDDDEIVVRASFRLSSTSSSEVERYMASIKALREQTQPVRLATSGSTFKNPKDQKAWILIDQASCRGLRVGGARVSEQHCNFLINSGNASAYDVESLGEMVRDRVLRVTGVELEWEVVRVGVASERLS